LSKFYISHIKSISPSFDRNSIVVAPRYFLWPSTMIREFYGYPDMQFIELRSGWEENIGPEDYGNTFIIDYDYNNDKLIDLTQKFRSREKLDE